MDWASKPHHFKCLCSPKNPRSPPQYAHLLLEAIATNLGPCPSTRSSTAWVLHAFLEPSNFRRFPQLFLNLTSGTCNGDHGCHFDRLALQCALHVCCIASHRTPFAPFIKSIPCFSAINTVLCSWQTAFCLRPGCSHGAINFRLSSPFSAPTPPGRQVALTNLSSADAPAGLMRAPDSRPSISVFAIRNECCLPHCCGNIPSLHRGTSCFPSRHFAPVRRPFGGWDRQCPRAPDENCQTTGASCPPWTTSHLQSSTSLSVAPYRLVDGSTAQTASSAITSRLALPVSSLSHHRACQRLHSWHYQHTSPRRPGASCSSGQLDSITIARASRLPGRPVSSTLKEALK